MTGCVPRTHLAYVRLSSRAEGDPGLGTSVLTLQGLASAWLLRLSFPMHTLEVELGAQGQLRPLHQQTPPWME